MCDFIRFGVAKKSEFIFVGSDIGKKSEYVLRVEFSANESTCDVDTTLNVLGENCRIDFLGLS